MKIKQFLAGIAAIIMFIFGMWSPFILWEEVLPDTLISSIYVLPSLFTLALISFICFGIAGICIAYACKEI